MTEESREPLKASPGEDRVVAGYGAERAVGAERQDQPDDDLQQPAEGPQDTDGRPSPESSEGSESSGVAEALGAAGPGPSGPAPGPNGQSAPAPADSVDWPGDQASAPAGQASQPAAGGFAPPDMFAKDDVPQPGQARPTAVETPIPEGIDGLSDPSRPRPGFAPHNHDPRAAAQGAPYGWPPHASHQPAPPPGPGSVPPPPGARPMGPPPPGGPRPMGGPPGGFGPSPTGPNWAPVPPPPVPSRGGPGIGVLAIIGLIVALVAGGVGAGIGVMATGDSEGGVSLGGGNGSGGPAVQNRPPDSVAGIAKRVLPSVVMIRVETGGGEGGAGTGFIVNGGYIVTNNHVVSAGGNAAGGQITVVFSDKKQLPATIKGRDPGSDIAVLKTEGQHSMPALTPGDSDQLAIGDPVIAIGSPLGLQGSVTTGIVSSLNRAVPTRGEGGGDGSVLNAIQTDAAINPGNSGGPLVDAKGRVIGINTAIATLSGGGLGGEQQSGSIGLGFAIPINQGKRVAEEIINTGSAKRTQLGIGMDQRFQGPGVKISETEQNGIVPIVKGGPAERAGLKPGDVITKINDQPIEDPSDLAAQIRSKAPGDKIKVTYTRGGKEATVEVTLAAA
ncbi:trypsin-like peptidase domain-containing protein [Spirillospora sp. NPDC047279]|uniref:S1C family serine protease n=1 Tax=Spirillospora sp. NPDC047279 TaxID=3155478 RepID=UPI0033C56018